MLELKPEIINYLVALKLFMQFQAISSPKKLQVN